MKTANSFSAIIRPGRGIGPITFGVSANDVIEFLGVPSEASLDEDGDKLLKYPDRGIAFLAFDANEDMRLVTYELTAKSNAELWGLKPFRLSLSEMARQAEAQGALLERVPQKYEDEHDVLYRLKSKSLSFYYDGESLTAIMGGVFFAGDEIQWP